MSNYFKFLPALALAASLAPLAAHARSGAVSNTDSSPQYVVNAPASWQTSPFSGGRQAQANTPAGQVLTNTAPQYATQLRDDTGSNG